MKKVLLSLLLTIMLVFPQIAVAQPEALGFMDTQEHWAQQDIEVVSSLGLMNGTGTTNEGFRLFSPADNVTRAQLAVVLERTFQLDYGQIVFIKQPQATDYYRDVENNAWYSEALVMCSINNIFEAAENFSPDRPVSRIEIAQSVYRSFNAKGISVPMIMMMPIFEDTGSLTQEETNAMVFVNNTGIMKGYNNLFRPNDNMTRAELAGVLARCVNLLAIDENYYSGKDYQVTSGQNFIIGLTSNPSTGYTWDIKNAGDDKIIKLVGNTYQGSIYDGLPIVGQAGRQFYKFQALQTGSTELQFVYARPWESVQPAKVFTLKVVVTP